MGCQFVALRSGSVCQCGPVDTLHGPVSAPASHLHDIGVRDAQRMGNTHVVMTEVVEAEMELCSGEADGSAEPVADLVRCGFDDRPGAGQVNSIEYEGRQVHSPV